MLIRLVLRISVHPENLGSYCLRGLGDLAHLLAPKKASIHLGEGPLYHLRAVDGGLPDATHHHEGWPRVAVDVGVGIGAGSARSQLGSVQRSLVHLHSEFLC